MTKWRYKMGRWLIRPAFERNLEVAYRHMKNGDSTESYGTGYWPGKFFGLRQLDHDLEHAWCTCDDYEIDP